MLMMPMMMMMLRLGLRRFREFDVAIQTEKLAKDVFSIFESEMIVVVLREHMFQHFPLHEFRVEGADSKFPGISVEERNCLR